MLWYGVPALPGVYRWSRRYFVNPLPFNFGNQRSRVTEDELAAIDELENARPESLRDFDQIPMRGADLLCQVKLVANELADKQVVFVGDHDGSSLLLGLLGAKGHLVPPSEMMLLDFDDRLLEAARAFASLHNFQLNTRLYNVFDPPPSDLLGHFDIFYTNRPYGASNQGESARLFIARGSELTHESGRGYVLLPNDYQRPWTQDAMRATQAHFLENGWSITTSIPALHLYHLDDDHSLTSPYLSPTGCRVGRGPCPTRAEPSEAPKFHTSTGVALSRPTPATFRRMAGRSIICHH